MWKTPGKFVRRGPWRFRRIIPVPIVLVIGAATVVLTAQPQQPALSGSPFAAPFTPLASPASDGSAQPNLTADRSGRVWLSWLESRAGGGHRFQLSSLQESTWARPLTIAEGANFLANWADFPSVFVTSTGTLAAHWLQRGISAPYGIQIRTSTDNGRTWTSPGTPHYDSASGEFGFVSFFETPDSGLGLVWLDGRKPAAGSAAPMSHGMAVRAATVRNGSPGAQTVVDPSVCECCQTSAARTAEGVVIAYRDRSDANIRDISVARFVKGVWSAPATVHADNWEINGCPVNGPVVTAVGDAVAVAWFTMAGGAPHVRVAFSTDGGRRFGAPIQAESRVTYGRLGMVMPSADRVLLSSIERGDEGVELVVREVTRDGRPGVPVVVAPSTSDRSSGFARLALSGRRLVVAWTEIVRGAPSRVKVASAPLR
ncbi:MAG TPA: sialidase family protein [Vicinamibacterales bacterium]|nr:sialidase family protein [Vicinamibacterales bacterium]